MKNIIRYIATFILTIALAAFLLINLASTTVLSEQYILGKLEDTDYYEKMYEYVNSCFENYIGQSGLEENVLENIVSKDKIKKDTMIIISNIYDGVNEDIDVQEIKDNLNNNIENSLNGQKLTQTQKMAISTFVDEICKEYKNAMVHTSYEKSINQTYGKVMKYINLAKKGIIILIGVDIILLLVISLRRIYRFFVMLGIASLSSGFLFSIINLYVDSKIKIQSITIFNNAFSDTIRNILHEVLVNISKQGRLLVLIGVCFIFVPAIIHHYRKDKFEQELNAKE